MKITVSERSLLRLKKISIHKLFFNEFHFPVADGFVVVFCWVIIILRSTSIPVTPDILLLDYCIPRSNMSVIRNNSVNIC